MPRTKWVVKKEKQAPRMQAIAIFRQGGGFSVCSGEGCSILRTITKVINQHTVHHLLGFLFDNLDYDCKWLKIDCFGSTLCLLLDFGQNELVKIGHLQLN